MKNFLTALTLIVLFTMCGSSMLFAQSSSKVIVKLNNSRALSSNQKNTLELFNCHKLGNLGHLICSTQNPEAAINNLKNKPDAEIKYIEDVAKNDWELGMNNTITPNDPEYINQWGLRGTSNFHPYWETAHNLGIRGENVIIAVFDAGIDWNHPDLVDNIYQNLGEDADGDGRVIEWDPVNNEWVHDPGDENGIDDDGNDYIDDFTGWDFQEDNNDTSGDDGYGFKRHGSHVSGIIGADDNNSIGISGIAPGVKIIPIKIYKKQPRNLTIPEALVSAYSYIFSLPVLPHITNHSYGGGQYSQSAVDMYEVADSLNIIQVLAAGNGGQSIEIYDFYPATYEIENFIVVGAIDSTGDRSTLSNYATSRVDIMCPGTNIISLGDNDELPYYYENGTSMAAPYTSGAIAMYLGLYPSATITDIKNSLITSADQTPELDGSCVANGYLNFYDFLTTGSHCDPVNINLSGHISGGQTYEGFHIATDSTTILDGVTLEGQCIEIGPGTKILKGTTTVLKTGDCREN